MSRSVLLLGAWALLVSCTSLGCGGGDDGGGGGGAATITDQPLTGKIGGLPFTFSQGETSAFLSADATFFTNLYNVAFTACSFGGPPVGSSSVIFEVPKMPGTYNLGLSQKVQTATLYDGAANFNHIATRGTIVIDIVTDTVISGGANVTFDANNAVDGKFTAAVCPE